MSFTKFFRIFWARRWIIITATLSVLVAGIVTASLLPPRYQATSRLMLDVVKPDPVTGTTMSGQFVRSYVQTQAELIKDYRFAGRVAEELGWTNSPDLAAQYDQRPASDKRDFRQWVAQRVVDNTNARLLEGSNILEIQYTSSDPETAARVADTLRDVYLEQTSALQREDATRNAAWFRSQATRIRGELTVAERKKTDFERANGIVLQDDKLDTDTARLAALAQSAPAAGAATVMTGPNPMEAQLAQVDAQIASMSKVLGPNNPDLLNMRRQREALASSARAASAPKAAGATGPSLQSLYNEQQRKVLADRGKVTEAQQLAADVTALRDQYAKTVARATDFEQQGQSTDIGVSALGAAIIPVAPSFPKWPLVIFGALGAGFALGLLVALIVELTRRRIRDAKDLEMPDIPVLGIMTQARTARRGIRARMPWRRSQAAAA